MNKTQKILLFLIMLLAVFLRFYKIAEMPGGLFPDEAANGIDINSMQQGILQPFYERGNGREALFFYMLWGSVELFGKGPWQHHIVSAGVGALAVLLCFLATRKLFGVFEKDESYLPRATNIALLASFLMAASSWHVVLSRTAFRANLIPLFATLTVYFLLKTYEAHKNNFALKKTLLFSFLTGAAFALGMYTYIAYRILVPILGVAVFWPLLAQIKQRAFWKTVISYKLAIISFTLAFCLFFAPLFHYFYTHPGSFIGRSGQVSVFNPELNQGNLLGAVGTVAYLSVQAYFTDGDLNWRHNISGWPFLSQLISPFFGIGLVLSLFFGIVYFFTPLKRQGLWKYFFLTGWFWGMLLPVVTTAEGIPHGLRAIGTIPVVFIITAWCLYAFVELIVKAHDKIWNKYEDSHLPHFQSTGHAAVGLVFKAGVVCFVAALILQTYFGYFVYAYNSPENFYAFRSDLTPVAEYLVQRCQKDSTYLVLDKFSVQTTDYITSDPKGDFSDPCSVPYKQVDPENVWELSGLKNGDEVVFTQSSIFDIKKFKEYHPEASLRLEYRNKFGQAVMAVYRIDN